MSEIHWLNPVNGSYANASDWSGGVVPGAADNAILDASGKTAYTVTVATAQTVNSIQTASTATLSIAGGFGATFTTSAGTGSGANAGTIQIEPESTLAVGGTLKNSGTIALIDGRNGSAIFLNANTTLDGGGTDNLGNTPTNTISGTAATLTNVDNTISGAGYIGGGRIALANLSAGVIDANGAIPLNIDTVAGTTVNAGLMEASGKGGLYIVFTTLDQSGGGAIAAAGGAVELQQVDIIGGTLRSSGAGAIHVHQFGASMFDGTTSAVTNQGRVIIDSGQMLTIQGAIHNNGLVAFASIGGAKTTLTIGAANATLDGGGSVALNKTGQDVIVGATSSATLNNVNDIIVGAGRLGDGQMTLVNGAGGRIIAEGAVALTIDTGPGTIANAGLIDAAGAGGGIIQSAINNTGVLEAGGGNLTVNGVVTGGGIGRITGGTLSFGSSFSQTVVFTGSSGVLELAQSQSYAGKVKGFSLAGGTSFDLRDIAFKSAGEATFSGSTTSGVLTVTDGAHTAHIILLGNYAGSTFVASSDGHGGVSIVHPASPASSTIGAHRFIEAAASLGGLGGGAIHMGEPWTVREPLLVKPRTMMV